MVCPGHSIARILRPKYTRSHSIVNRIDGWPAYYYVWCCLYVWQGALVSKHLIMPYVFINKLIFGLFFLLAFFAFFDRPRLLSQTNKPYLWSSDWHACQMCGRHHLHSVAHAFWWLFNTMDTFRQTRRCSSSIPLCAWYNIILNAVSMS